MTEMFYTISNCSKENYGIKTHRTKISQDVELLKKYGYKIGGIKERTSKYFYAQQTFDCQSLNYWSMPLTLHCLFTRRRATKMTSKASIRRRPHRKKPTLAGSLKTMLTLKPKTRIRAFQYTYPQTVYWQTMMSFQRSTKSSGFNG